MIGYVKRKKLARLRENWETAYRWDREFNSIKRLYELTYADHTGGIVDDKTWHDLDMNSVFRQLDATQTSVGQQYLYRKLRLLAEPEGQLEDDFRIAEILRKNAIAREQLQLRLAAIKEGDASAVSSMLFDQFPIVKLSKFAIIGWSLVSVTGISIALITGGNWIFLILPFVVANFSISRHFERATDKITYVFYYLYNVIAVSESIAYLNDRPELPACEELSDNIKAITRVKKVLKLVSISQNHEGVIINNLMYLLNLTFLYDLIVYTYSVNLIVKETDVIRSCYLAIGAIDSSISTASYINRHPGICNPTLLHGCSINLEDSYHPLIETPVTNSFLSSKSALVTGSNMAGKTTFIKTIGVNLILARTLWFSHATRAQFPVLDIYSSIKTEDGLEQGKSFYFTELERLSEFLKVAKGERNCLFLIDEIYRGTNTVERIAGSAAVLKDLASTSTVFVTTHDVELAAYLSKEFEMWYFEESGNLNSPFDYVLRSGICKTRNALELMKNMGYPEHITANAMEIALELDKNNQTKIS